MIHPERLEHSPNTLSTRVNPEVVLAAKAQIRPAILTATPGALCLLKALRRRWALALGLGLLLAGLVGGTTFALFPRSKYVASATLQVATRPYRIMFSTQERETDYRTYQKTQMALIKNGRVLSHTLGKPEVAKLVTVSEQVDANEWLEQNLKVEFPSGSEVLEISLSGDRPEDLAKIVDEVVDSYMTVVVAAEHTERVGRLDKLRVLRQKYDEELKKKRQSLRQTVDAVGVSDPMALALSQQFKAEHLSMAQRELMRVESELLKAQSELAVLNASAGSRARSAPKTAPAARVDRVAPAATQPAVASERVERHPRVQELKRQADELASRDRDVARIARNSLDPARTQLRARRATVLEKLEAERKAAAMELAAEDLSAAQASGISRTEGISVAAPEGLSERAKAQEQVAVLRTYGDALSKDIERLQNEVKESSKNVLDLENERGEIGIATDVSRQVGAEVEAVQVELGAPERIRKLASARIPNKKDELRNFKVGGGAALGAFACALLGVSFWEHRIRRVAAVDEVINGLGIRLVGTLPPLPRRGRLVGSTAAIARDRNWQGRMVESVDAMRALLQHTSRCDGTRVVMIASAVKGEGKTSLACHLATSLTRGGRRTLLIDADLRSPACHRLFNTSPEPGLCEVLRGEIAIEDAVQQGIEFGPSFLPAGRMDALALQYLSCDGLRILADVLRDRYDFIVIDSSPVLPVADALLVAQAVDAVIFSVMRDVSRLPMVYEAHERLAALGARMIGAVVAGVQVASHEYEYQSQLIA